MRRLLLLLWHTALLLPAALAQSPAVMLENGPIHARVYLPDPDRGFYRGTRFDWSGVIDELTYAGHSFYGPWFTRIVPGVRDFIFDGPEITAGSCSAVTGPAEDFLDSNGLPLGFSKTQPGHTFVKIGVGTLRRPDDQAYSPYRLYDVVDHGHWTVKTTSSSVRFTQRILDPDSGFGYLYTKTLRLVPGKPILVMDHTLRNLGRLPIDTSVYDHNFLVLDHQTTGPDFSVRLPFSISPLKPIKSELGAVYGDRITYRKPLQDNQVFTVQIGGIGTSSRDYDVSIENARAGVGMRITGDRPLEKAELWSIRSTVAMEPFIHLTAAPGKSIHWRYTYTYYTLPSPL